MMQEAREHRVEQLAVSRSKRDGWQALRERNPRESERERPKSAPRALCLEVPRSWFTFQKARRYQKQANIKSAPIESLSQSAKSFKVKRF